MDQDGKECGEKDQSCEVNANSQVVIAQESTTETRQHSMYAKNAEKEK